MCGIVSAIAKTNITPLLIEGLRRLEYRGYDSCGVAVYRDGQLERSRSTSRVAELDQQVNETGLNGNLGIAHTRWATHGVPSTNNAHPHFSNRDGKPFIGLVHNGIIENHEVLRKELQGHGFEFESQTDTEVVAHLINHYYEDDLFKAMQQAVKRLDGAYSLAVICVDEPDRLVGARHGSPLVAGVGDNANYLASDPIALAGTTNKIIYLEHGDVIDVTVDSIKVTDAEGNEQQRETQVVDAHAAAADLEGFRHYMQKEIFEQPRALGDTLQGIEGPSPELFGDNAEQVFKEIDSILILACGTSYYAGLTARYWIEAIATVPVNVEIASEYRYRESVSQPNTLVITISQSGETADTLAALNHAQSLGMKHTLTICNVKTSAMVRETELNFLTRAGVEIGVASTKAFTTQLVGLFLLTLTLAKVKGRLDADKEDKYMHLLRHLPAAITSVLALEPQIISWSEQFANKENALFLGRGSHYPIALEGALKLKEISYIHAEAYPAGELKHGPLALVTDKMPVVVVAPNDELIEKLKSNMQEVRARGGVLYVFADDQTHIEPQEGMHVLRMPEHYGPLSSLIHVIPLQLLAYHTAVARGTDVDKPRNLAKSVTVE